MKVRRYRIILNISLILILILAIMAVTVNKLLKVILITAIFSVIASFIYLLLGAPDVALAETIIGSTLSTIILLVAIKRYKLFTVYYIAKASTDKTTLKIINIIENSLKEHEIEPHIIFATETVKQIQNSQSYDIIVEQTKNKIIIYGKENSFNTKSILEQIRAENLNFKISIKDDTEIKKYRYKGENK